MTKISIAMATFNGARFLLQQLQSFSRQTLFPDELVVCDDGSTDSTIGIISEFSRSAPFPVVLVQNAQRLGYTANFLQAARMCCGHLIAFSDQDDEWLPQKLFRIRKAAEGSDALVFAHSTEWIDENGRALGVLYPNDFRFRSNLRKNDFPGHAIALKKSLLEMTARSLTASNYQQAAGDLEIGHDVLLMEIATAMGKVFFLPEVLARWRVHSETNHAWTGRFKQPSGAGMSITNRVYPPDLAQRYAAAGTSYRKHAAVLSSVILDLAAVAEDTSSGSTRLIELIDQLRKHAAVMELRARFYGEKSGKARLRLMLEGTAMGQYRNAARGGVGIHNALRDFVACFFH